MEQDIEIQPDSTLAQVVGVLALEPIQGADRIELATVLGWKVIVQKSEFKVGDLAIYYSIGSILPKDDPNVAFLKGKPLKTIKMRGVYSQGLLGQLTWVERYGVDGASLREGDDLTEKLQVKKWVPAEEAKLYLDDTIVEGRIPFPACIRKTNEPRIQNCCGKLRELEGKNIIITQKYDGTSTTYVCLDGNFRICGRNYTLSERQNEINHYFDIADRYDLKEKMIKFGKNIAIQGEIIGPKINKNRHNIKDLEYYVFNIFDIDRQYYMNWDEILSITGQLGLKTVPVVYRGMMKPEWLLLDNLLKLSTDQRYDTGTICEGIVVKSDLPYGFPRTSFKVISNEYLVKYRL